MSIKGSDVDCDAEGSDAAETRAVMENGRLAHGMKSSAHLIIPLGASGRLAWEWRDWKEFGSGAR